MFNLGYREIFFKCDLRYQRVLDDEEMAQLPRVLGIELDHDELDMVRKEMDVHKHGIVEWNEWLDWWRGDSPGVSGDSARGLSLADLDSEALPVLSLSPFPPARNFWQRKATQSSCSAKRQQDRSERARVVVACCARVSAPTKSRRRGDADCACATSTTSVRNAHRDR